LNEYGGDFMAQTTYSREDNIYNHVKKLVGDRVPIGAIGLEFHLTVPSAPESEPTTNAILANFECYSKLGLKVHVTELDVKIMEPVTQEKLDTQARFYSTVMGAVLRSDSCKSISVWGYTNAYSWIDTFNTFPWHVNACIFDKNIIPKPVYNSIMEVLRK
jgi:endo-1,4-beta-xylanase